jgi:hypothetical protein
MECVQALRLPSIACGSPSGQDDSVAHTAEPRYHHPMLSPPPWSVEDKGACFVVKDRGGQKLAYVYCEGEPGRRSSAKLLTRVEARRIAANVAKLPVLGQVNMDRAFVGGCDPGGGW